MKDEEHEGGLALGFWLFVTGLLIGMVYNVKPRPTV